MGTLPVPGQSFRYRSYPTINQIMIRSIIVEDDLKHSDRLHKLLAQANNFIEIKQVCYNVEDAIEAINKYNPELIFLDINMNGNNKGGFELLQKIKDITFHVIFTTAHIDENISEIRRCGLHYIIKPYILSEVKAAMEKYEEKQNRSEAIQIKTLRSNLIVEKIEDKVIYIDHEGNLYPIHIREIIYCFSKDTLMTFVIKTANEELNLSKIRRHNLTAKGDKHKDYLEWEKYITMKALETDFADLNFCRIHNRFLVNMLHVRRFIPGISGNGKVVLSNGESLEVSAAGKKEFLRKTGRG